MTEPVQPRKKTLLRRLADIRPADLVVLFFLCVAVGVLLAFFNIDPAYLWVDFFATVADAWHSFFGGLADFVINALKYFLLGAVIILPIWAVWHVLRAVLRR